MKYALLPETPKGTERQRVQFRGRGPSDGVQTYSFDREPLEPDVALTRRTPRFGTLLVPRLSFTVDEITRGSEVLPS